MAVSELQVPQITLSLKSTCVGVLLPCLERWVLLLATAHPRGVPVDPCDGQPVPKPAVPRRRLPLPLSSRITWGGVKGLSGDPLR